MNALEAPVHVEAAGGILRRHLLSIPPAEEAGKEEVMKAVIAEFARREGNVRAKQGRLPL